MTNHPTQGLQDMTLDLSTYSDTGLKELQTRIEEEKTKRERNSRKPFEVTAISGRKLWLEAESVEIAENLDLRLTAEAKLRAAGGGSFISGARNYFLYKDKFSRVAASSEMIAYQGTIYFKSSSDAMLAYATLTPDEQAAIFGFGEG